MATEFVCDSAKPLLSPFLDKMTSEEETRLVKEHLVACPDCRKDLDELLATIAILRDSKPPESPAGLQSRIRHAVERERRSILRFFIPAGQERILLAAASMLGFALFVGLGIHWFGAGVPHAERPEDSYSAGATSEEQEAPAAQKPMASALEEALGRTTNKTNRAKGAPASARKLSPIQPSLSGSGPRLAALKASDFQSKDSRALHSAPGIERTKLSAAKGRRREAQILEEKRKAIPKDDAKERDAVRSSSRMKRETVGSARVKRRSPKAPPAPSARAEESVAADELRVETEGEAIQKSPARLQERNRVPPPERSVQTTGAAVKALADEPRLSAKPQPSRPPKQEVRAKRRPTKRLTALRYRIDDSTGRFKKSESGKPAGKSGQSPMAVGKIASLHVLDHPEPLLKLVVPTPSASLGEKGEEALRGAFEESKEADLPEISYRISVRTGPCDPETPGAPGSDQLPLQVRRYMDPPVPLNGLLPTDHPIRAGATVTLSLIVRRDGTVLHAAARSSQGLPSDFLPAIVHSIYRWQFLPARCDGTPAAAQVALQIDWR